MERISHEQRVNIEKWLEALRSGDYRQMSAELWTDDGGNVNTVDDCFVDPFAGELANLNDGGSSFQEIADLIEERAAAIDPNWREA